MLELWIVELRVVEGCTWGTAYYAWVGKAYALARRNVVLFRRINAVKSVRSAEEMTRNIGR